MGFWNKVKKGVTDTGNTVAHGAEAAWDGTQKAVVCTQAIANCAIDVQGHDPRTWMTACAKETIFKGGGADDFKHCLIGKMQKEAKDISDPVGYANKLYDSIKGKCS